MPTLLNPSLAPVVTHVLLPIAALLTVGLLAGRIARRLRQPAVLGELIGGILLGPTFFGALAPALYASLFPKDPVLSTGRSTVVQTALLFFMFVAGQEVDLSHLRRRAVPTLCTSLMGILLPFGLGFGSVILFPGLWGGQGDSLLLACFVGTAMSISALPVIARILMDLNLIRTEAGGIVITAAAIDDLIGWFLFALILSRFTPGDIPARNPALTLLLMLVFFAAFLGPGRWISQRTLYWLRSSRTALPSGFIGVAAVCALVAAAGMEQIGFHAALGAFLMGAAFAPREQQRTPAHEAVHSFVLGFFAPIYFVSVGLRADFASNFDPMLVLLVLLVACLGKIIGAGCGAWIGGIPAKQALAIGFGMNARGAMEIILATVALEHGLIEVRIFVALVVMALVTSLLSGPAMQRLLSAQVQ